MAEKKYTEGLVLVVFQKNITEEEARRFVTGHKLTSGRWLKNLRILHVHVPFGEESKWVKEFNKREDLVRVAELSYLHTIS